MVLILKEKNWLQKISYLNFDYQDGLICRVVSN